MRKIEIRLLRLEDFPESLRPRVLRLGRPVFLARFADNSDYAKGFGYSADDALGNLIKKNEEKLGLVIEVV